MSYQRTPLQIALRKRKEAFNSIEVHKRGIAGLEARIAALSAEIERLGGAPPPRNAKIDFRAKGELSRNMFDLLREKGEATAQDLAARMLTLYTLDTSDHEVMYALRQRCTQAFARAYAKGLIYQVGWSDSPRRGKHGRFKRWALKPTSRVQSSADRRGRQSRVEAP